MEYCIVLTTLPDHASAKKLAQHLVANKLAACINIIPELTSIYHWDEKIEESKETQLVIKTVAEKVSDLEIYIKQQHPYDVPEFVVLKIESGSAEYLNWIAKVCG